VENTSEMRIVCGHMEIEGVRCDFTCSTIAGGAFLFGRAREA
jgi:hypothetical protein